MGEYLYNYSGRVVLQNYRLLNLYNHDEMKTSIEYRKRKRRIAQDEDKQTEEIELRKLRKSSVKVFKYRYEQTFNTIMRK